ncbi:MAG TPA: riboflavin synthase [Candidatus Methylacidiphilales bacterium]|nr:riboflavin synthase [Candidatus Methylacidiphilales bacterium]
MFTGLVEGTGRVVNRLPNDGGTRLIADAASVAEGTRIGDSIAVNGCCLTVASIDGVKLGFDLLAETEARTNLGGIQPGAMLNLERALPAAGRYGGHFVTGHIDATGLVRSWRQAGRDFELRIGIEPAHGIYLVPKGCIAVDGISLTVVEVTRDEFSVWIIPHTREITALSQRAGGNCVNLEFDLLAKYTEKILAARNSLK